MNRSLQGGEEGKDVLDEKYSICKGMEACKGLACLKNISLLKMEDSTKYIPSS